MTAPVELTRVAPRRAGCGWCGKTAEMFNAELYRREHLFMCETCTQDPPPRAPRVYPGVPRWMRSRLNAKLPREVADYIGKFNRRRTRLASASETWSFILNSREVVVQFDHWGRDSEDNLVTEPYADHTPDFEAHVAGFANRLEVRHSIRLPSWHAPWDSTCLRVTFHRPETP
jgi:hypothetical protein